MKPMHAVRFMPAVVALSAVACGANPMGPSSSGPVAVLSTMSQSTHFHYHLSRDDAVDAQRQEAFYDWAAAALGVQVPRAIDYYKYRDRAQMAALTGHSANGWADPPVFAVHTIFPWDDHETVHVLTALIGRPSDFFNEGIAVAMSTDPFDGRFEPLWQGQPVHQWARSYQASGSLVPIGGIVETTAFRQLPDSVSYPEAGSFMRFLIDEYGMAPVVRFFGGGTREDGAATSAARFLAAFGTPMDEAIAAWEAFIQAYR